MSKKKVSTTRVFILRDFKFTPKNFFNFTSINPKSYKHGKLFSATTYIYV